MSTALRLPLRRGTVAVLVLAAIAAPWWLTAIAPAGVAALLLGRWETPRRYAGIAVVAGVLSGSLAAARRPETLPVQIAVVAGLAVAVGAADALGRLLAARARYREQGWQLAEAVHRQERASSEAARTAERSRIAGEVHDALGHDMALLAMQLSALQVQVRQGQLPAPALSERLVALQAAAAAATERLHTTIGLLEPDAPTPAPTGGWSAAVVEQVERARSAGLDVRLAGPDPALDAATPVVGRTVLRLVAEAMTNASKHASGQPLELAIRVDAGAVQLAAANAAPVSTSAVGSGRGLKSITERLHLLGGELRTDHRAGRFQLTAQLPLHATPVTPTGPGTERARAHGQGEVARRRRSLVLVPAGTLLIAAVVLATAFVVANLGSVLPRERFLALRVGQPRAVAESLLPPVQLPDAPQTVAEPSADCRYYEERVSFFERVTTFQLCFADGTLVSATEIPAERSR